MTRFEGLLRERRPDKIIMADGRVALCSIAVVFRERISMPVTHDDVEWCYRSILGRTPESTGVVARHAASARDFRSLVLKFIGSMEYRQTKLLQPLLPLENAPMRVDINASPLELAELRKRTRQAWSQLGSARPYYSVLSGEEYLPQNITDDLITQFWASGARELSQVTAILKRHRFDNYKSKNCVEYGCGLGRVTFPLATIFGHVDAYDISDAHLALAKQRASDDGVSNVTFHQSSGDSPAIEQCDFFYSRIVFQHNTPPIMRELIMACLQSLRESGVAIFQVPTYATDYAFRLNEYLESQPATEMEMHFIPQEEIFAAVDEAHCQVLEVREDGSIGRPGEWISNTFVVRRKAPVLDAAEAAP